MRVVYLWAMSVFASLLGATSVAGATADTVCTNTTTAWSAMDVGGIVTAAIGLASAFAAWIRAREKREIEKAHRERLERILCEQAERERVRAARAKRE